MTMRIGPRPHGATNVMQVTFVFNELGDLRSASGYERDVEGTTFGQWREMASGNLGGRQLATSVLQYLHQRLLEVDSSG